MTLAQVNIRVPDDAREALLQVGARLRADPGFLEHLQAFLAQCDDPTASPTLAKRVADLEARMAALEGKG